MERRDALKNVACLMGGTISAVTLGVINHGCKPEPKRENTSRFNNNQKKIISEIAETIIPSTDTPGAKAAGVGSFIIMMIRDCYPTAIQRSFADGVEEVEKRSKSFYGHSFISISPENRKELLTEFETDTLEMNGMENSKGPHFFQLMKELTVLGYFTSEVGVAQVLSYVANPGRYEGCIAMKGD